MYCINCGKEVDVQAKFCDNCGAKILQEEKAEPMSDILEPDVIIGDDFKTPPTYEEVKQDIKKGKKISCNIFQDEDGTYRWVYELNLLKSPSILFLIWKIFFFIIFGIFVMTTIFDLANWGAANLLDNLKMFGYFILGMTVLVGISYLIYVAIMGGKYCVVFEMTEEGIMHRQMPKQARKAEIIADITILAGLATRSYSTRAAGFAASKTEMYTTFSSVGKIKTNKRTHTIKLREGFSHNQVYAETEDFNFVEQFIRTHCSKAK